MRLPIGLLCQPRVIMMMGRNWWNDWQGKPKYSEKTCPNAALSITNPTCCRTRTRATAVGSQRLTAWATARPRSGECWKKKNFAMPGIEPPVARRYTDWVIPTPEVVFSSKTSVTSYQITWRQTTVMHIEYISFPMTEFQRSVGLVPFIQCYLKERHSYIMGQSTQQ
jgi:hypothetical protein